MGPLHGYTVIELAGIGPAPMGGMMLADMGAEVIRIDRAAGASALVMKDVSWRGKKSVVINLKDPGGIETLLRLRKVGHWPGRLPGAQPQTGVRAYDWLGPGRPAGAQRGA
jgi:CoA-transferase family III